MATWQNTSGFIRETTDDVAPEQTGWTRISGLLESWPSERDQVSDEEAREQLDYLVVGD